MNRWVEYNPNPRSGRVGDCAIIALTLRNNDEIMEYFKISKTQAKFSFGFSVISCELV